MPITIDLITRKKLILVKQLYQQAVVQSVAHHSYVGRIMSLIAFDLAAETVLKAIVAALEPSKSVDNSFQSLIQQADKLMVEAGLPSVPDKANIQHVHSLRNDAQHKAKYPNETDVSDCRTYVRDLLQKIIADVWGLSFENLSLADVVQDDEVKEYLLTAQDALENGEYTEALVHAEAGLKSALLRVEATFVGRLDSRTRAFITMNWREEQIVDDDTFHAFERMRHTFLLSTVGLSISGYWRYHKRVYTVISSLDFLEDGGLEFEPVEGEVEPELTSNDAEFVVAYAVNAVLQIENFVGDFDSPFGITW